MLISKMVPPLLRTVHATWLGRLVAPEVPTTISRRVSSAAWSALWKRKMVLVVAFVEPEHVGAGAAAAGGADQDGGLTGRKGLAAVATDQI